MIGKNTVASMQSGLLFGYVGLVDGIVQRMQKEIDFPARVVATAGGHVLDECLEGLGASDFRGLVAVEDEALDLLGAHDGSGPATAQAVPLVVLDAGEAQQILAGRPDHAGLGLGHAGLGDELLFGLESVQTPHVIGRVNGGALLRDLQVDRHG